MFRDRSVEIDFGLFFSAKERVQGITDTLRKITNDELFMHASELKGIWECGESRIFLQKEVKVTGLIEESVGRIDEEIMRIDEEATLLYKIEQLNTQIGMIRNF